MAQVGSSPTRLSSVISVFGGGNAMRANYLRGGTYVKNIANAYPNIASSGTLYLSGFAGVINPTTFLYTAYDEYDYALDANAFAYCYVRNTGYIDCGARNDLWLLAGGGNVADYDVYFEKLTSTVQGTTNTWLNLATTRSVYVSRTTVGSSFGNGNIYLRMNASPQTILNTATFYLQAEKESSGGCSTCCFTPDTLITMSDGLTKPIEMVVVGDRILTANGEKEVTEIITRTYRVMYTITFADGRILNASEDHPLYVVGKGYASINPTVEYKELGVPEKLEVGDFVLDQNGNENEIVSITDLDYPDTVYTFAESEFYANGMLVY